MTKRGWRERNRVERQRGEKERKKERELEGEKECERELDREIQSFWLLCMVYKKKLKNKIHKYNFINSFNSILFVSYKFSRRWKLFLMRRKSKQQPVL